MNGTRTSGEIRFEALESRVAVIEHRQPSFERLMKQCLDNTSVLLQRTDPLTASRRGALLFLGAATGSLVATAIAHTIWLAYLR